eukprot:5085182-Prymnesium_polylepis.1
MRTYDIVIFGATGYTGEHVARSVQRMVGDGSWASVRWAIAGRSKAKLDALVSANGLNPTGIVVADTSDAASLLAMAASTRVILNATGPYRFFGEPVVEACINAGTDYTDLCGEPEFIDRMLLKHGDRAAAQGVLVVHACAFDSVPADIGTIFTAMQFAPPALCAHASMFHTFDVNAGRCQAPSGASAHATTFYAAVHGIGGVAATRAQRKELMAKLEAQEAGSSKGPKPLGPRLKGGGNLKPMVAGAQQDAANAALRRRVAQIRSSSPAPTRPSFARRSARCTPWPSVPLRRAAVPHRACTSRRSLVRPSA